MKLRKTLTRNAGTTILEAAIVIGIVSALAGITLALGINTWQRALLRRETDIIVSLLYKARSQALSNIGASDHGIYIDETKRQYILFEGESLPTATSKIAFGAGKGLTFTGDTEIVFRARTGTSKNATLTINGRGGSNTITVNTEGGITQQ